MKKQPAPLFNTLSVDERANLTIQSDEILAAGFNLPRQKNFHNASFWEIQHQQRSMPQ
jgi:hypothetical protein